MSEGPTLVWVEIENFRGFRDPQRIDLDASVVIATGPNGTGKTSFFDAIQWLMLGSIERLEPWRPRKNTEHIVNAWRLAEPAVVSAGIRIGSEIATARRQGRYDSGLFEWSSGEGVERGEEAERRLAATLAPSLSSVIALRRMLMTSALLQQDDVREVLEDKPADRYQHLAGILGLNDVAAFPGSAKRRADRFALGGNRARQEVDALAAQIIAARERLSVLQQQLADQPDIHAATTELMARVQEHADVLAMQDGLPPTVSEAAILQATARDCSEEVRHIASRAAQIEQSRASATKLDEEALSKANQELAAADEQLSSLRSQAAEAANAYKQALEQSHAVAALASQALPLLGSTCPVCAQPIDRDQVAAHLEEILDSAGSRLTPLKKAADDAEAVISSAMEARAKAQAGAEQVEAQRRRDVDLAAEIVSLQQSVQRVIEMAIGVGLRVKRDKALTGLNTDVLLALSDAFRSVSQVGGAVLATLRGSTLGQAVATATSEVSRLERQVGSTREAAAAASAREEEAKTLHRAATRASAAVTENRFRQLAPLVGDIFSRLDPHPAFKTLDFALGVYREKGVATPVVRDIDEGVEADPLIVFSSAQANVAALAYFLALNWAAGSDGLPFVLLDDPLQSMDDVNALGFADLCRHIRRDRQLVVSTHDRRLAALLERKLAPRTPHEQTRVLEFEAWSRHGPVISSRMVDTQADEGRKRVLVSTAG